MRIKLLVHTSVLPLAAIYGSHGQSPAGRTIPAEILNGTWKFPEPQPRGDAGTVGRN